MSWRSTTADRRPPAKPPSPGGWRLEAGRLTFRTSAGGAVIRNQFNSYADRAYWNCKLSSCWVRAAGGVYGACGMFAYAISMRFCCRRTFVYACHGCHCCLLLLLAVFIVVRFVFLCCCFLMSKVE